MIAELREAVLLGVKLFDEIGETLRDRLVRQFRGGFPSPVKKASR